MTIDLTGAILPTAQAHPDAGHGYIDPGMRSATKLVAKYWAEAIAQGVKNPERWVTQRCVDEVQRAQTLIEAGLRDEG